VPRRVVALTPSASELVAAVGATDTLVGVDQYSSYPPEVASLPKVGSFLQPNLEAIIALKPDLVITDDIHEDVAGALRDAGIEAMVVPIHALPDVQTGLETVGARLGHPTEARAAIDRIDAAVDAASSRHHAPRLRVLAIIDRAHDALADLYAAGPGSWLDELLALEGTEDVLAESGVRYAKISPEEIVRTAPDVIVDVTFGVDAATAERIYGEAGDIPAVRNHRVITLSAAYLQAPSPRVDQALADLDAALYPAKP
jgi:iron complex transport system substrate-binding protein